MMNLEIWNPSEEIMENLDELIKRDVADRKDLLGPR